MPTQSSQAARIKANGPTPASNWAARATQQPRSVFGNYRAQAPAAVNAPPTVHTAQPDLGPKSSGLGPSLQSAIDTAVARSFIYRFLAHAYEDPTVEGWDGLRSLQNKRCLLAAVNSLARQAAVSPQIDPAPRAALPAAATVLLSQLAAKAFDAFFASYLAAFGHAARGRCPLNEIEYGDIKADPLFQPHRLADLAAFYRAFGLEVADGAGERHDHICLELEFMCVLAAKEAYALEHQHDSEDLAVCRGAQKRFLREHLGRWAPAFSRRLERMARDPALGALASFTRCFVEADCARHGVVPGSEDLLLRPVDEAAESLCASCSVGQTSA